MRYEVAEIKIDYQSVKAEQNGYRPTLSCYVLDESKELIYSHERPAVIICPGGAYERKSDREAEIVAMRYLAAGIHAFVLQYSVAPSRYPSAVLELAASVAYVREHAAEYHVNPDKIVLAGFSAGGHLCACLGNLWDESLFEKGLDFEKSETKTKIWKPNGMILSYPVITMGKFTHEKSRRSLLGDKINAEDVEKLSMEKRVSEKTVPVFLWHTRADDTVPVENALEFALALQKHGIPFELHIYEKGCHGLSLCDDTVDDGMIDFSVDNANWMEMAINWLKRLP